MMEILKKNVIAFVCIAVALVAVIAWFWPVGSMYSSLDDKLHERQTVFNSIKTLAGQQFTAPNISRSDVLPKPGTWFPDQADIDETKKKTAEFKQKADETLQVAVAINHQGHDLLQPGSLPQPLEGMAFQFRSKYNNVMDRGGKPERDPTRRDPWPLNLPDEVLESTTLATPEDIKTAVDKKWKDEYEQKVITANGQDVNRKEVEAQFAKDTETFARDFSAARARNFKIYTDPDALVRAPRLTPSDTPSAGDIWFAQMTLWVEQDVCQTIRDMNKDSTHGVVSSPVKNLMEVSLAPDLRMYVTAQDIATGGAAPAAADPSQPLYARSPTGRVCNSLFDVVHFHVSVVIEASQVRPFLQQLRYGRFITVLNMQTQTVDTRAAVDQGYIYGSAPCVTLSLDCEALFMRDWTARTLPTASNPVPGIGPMPPEVQQRLGIPPPANSTTPAPGGNRVALGQ